MTRPLSSSKVGEIAVGAAFAALDIVADQEAVLAAWPAISAMMPLALGLAASAIEARGPMTPEMREAIYEIMQRKDDHDGDDERE